MRVMYALFEEAGKFLAGRVMSEAEASVQVELDSGKRVKVKAAHVLLRFDKPAPAALIAARPPDSGSAITPAATPAITPITVGMASLAASFNSLFTALMVSAINSDVCSACWIVSIVVNAA